MSDVLEFKRPEGSDKPADVEQGLKGPAEVIVLPGETCLDIPAERVLHGGLKADLEVVFLLGRQKNGETYFAGSTSDPGKYLLLMELAKRVIVT